MPSREKLRRYETLNLSMYNATMTDKRLKGYRGMPGRILKIELAKIAEIYASGFVIFVF